MNFDQDTLRELADEAGRHLRERFAEWKHCRGIPVTAEETASKDMCRAAAVAMAVILTRETGWQWTVVGGWATVPKGWEDHVFASMVPGGIQDASGSWRGHYWSASEVDPCNPEAPVCYVDVAGDQFGYPETLVTHEGDRRYRENLCPMGMEAEIGAGALRHGVDWAEEFLAAKPEPPVRCMG